MAGQITFYWDEENTAHLDEYHPDVSPSDVDSILLLPVVAMDNTHGRQGKLFIGVDRYDRLLAVPAIPVGRNLWKPKTAHQARSAWQRNLYSAKTGRTIDDKGKAQPVEKGADND